MSWFHNINHHYSSAKIDIETMNENEGLLGLIRKPPQMQKEIDFLPREALSGFRLKPGSLDHINNTLLLTSHRKKKKRRENGDHEGRVQTFPDPLSM